MSAFIVVPHTQGAQVRITQFYLQITLPAGLAVWLSGNVLASINVVALRQTRLVLGWVTVCGRVNHFSM